MKRGGRYTSFIYFYMYSFASLSILYFDSSLKAILDSPCPSVVLSFRYSVILSFRPSDIFVSVHYLENGLTESDQILHTH